MSRSQRDKGKRGQREAERVLLERDYQIAELNSGRMTEDLMGTDPMGRLVSVEVKWHKLVNLLAFRAQAKEQARKRKAAWLLMVRVPDHPRTFYVEGQHIEPTVWKGNRP